MCRRHFHQEEVRLQCGMRTAAISMGTGRLDVVFVVVVGMNVFLLSLRRPGISRNMQQSLSLPLSKGSSKLAPSWNQQSSRSAFCERRNTATTTVESIHFSSIVFPSTASPAAPHSSWHLPPSYAQRKGLLLVQLSDSTSLSLLSITLYACMSVSVRSFVAFAANLDYLD